jgi:NAD(P)H-dependent flavin oxidoreductase YrpB (nitropropane dioxygenase family)
MVPGLLDADLPITAAPMAGGPTTPALVTAVTGAGGFAFLAAGYLAPDALQADIDAVRPAGSFGVNLFVPQRDASGALVSVDPVAFAAYAEALTDEGAALGVQLNREPVNDDDDAWPGKLALLTADPVPVVSLTFGLPPAADITALRRAGTIVLATVTTAGEAREAEAAGVDGLVVQGPRGGGHSGTFDPTRIPGSQPTLEILQAVRATTALPLIAAGGVDGPDAVAELLQAGAESVAVGTLLLLADEGGTSITHRVALSDPRFDETVITRAFTGRPARGLRNAFIGRYEPIAPVGFLAIHHLTRELRRAAARNHDPERLHLWAGTGYRQARPGPAAAIIRQLAGVTPAP